MKTEVIMKRELFGGQISQKSKSEFFSLTDLVKLGNKWRVANNMDLFDHHSYFKTKSSKEFIDELEKRYGKVKINSVGKNRHTWVHPLLFIDVALAISPKLKIEVYEWLFDSLLRYRNDSGDSYKEMSAALYVRYKNNRDFPKFISKVADYIKGKCGVKDWQLATEEQLHTRDKMHNSIKTLSRVLDDPREIVRLGVDEHLKISQL